MNISFFGLGLGLGMLDDTFLTIKKSGYFCSKFIEPIQFKTCLSQ